MWYFFLGWLNNLKIIVILRVKNFPTLTFAVVYGFSGDSVYPLSFPFHLLIFCFFVISLGSFVLLYVLSHLLALFASYLVFKPYCYRHSIANFALLLVSVALRKYSCCTIKDMKLFTIPQTQKYMLPSAVDLYRRRLFTLSTALTTAKPHKSQGGSRLC